jgi:hypothetical protein
VSCCRANPTPNKWCACKSNFSKKSLLTIGMPCYDDFDGVYFSTQSILMYHKDVLPYVRLLVVDNNPTSRDGGQTREYCQRIGATYIPFQQYSATTVKEIIFKYADTPYVLCMDSHVMLELGSLTKLLMYYQCNENTNDLLQGPLLSENPNERQVWTHLDLMWNDEMFGVWSHDARGDDPNGEPFEIAMQGMGLFSCRKDAWVGFNKNFRGFGGEEWYIHQKFKKNSGRTMCLPFLRWMHKFRRAKPPYKVKIEDKIKNYYIGFLELGLDITPITDHFHKKCGIEKEELDHLLFEAKCCQPH